jgi:hypothetical protein
MHRVKKRYIEVSYPVQDQTAHEKKKNLVFEPCLLYSKTHSYKKGWGLPAELECELRALNLPVLVLTTESGRTPAFFIFASVIFQIGSPIYAMANLDCNSPIYTFDVARITIVSHCTRLQNLHSRPPY